MDTFFVQKQRNNFADELLAAGLIRVLRQLTTATITQENCGNYWKVTLDRPLDSNDVATTAPFYPAPIIMTEKNKAKLPDWLPAGGGALINYEKEKKDRAQYLEAFKALDKTAKRAHIVGEAHPLLELLPDAPHQHWNIFRLLNPAALTSTNGLMIQWAEIGKASLTGTVCQLLLDLFATLPNDVEGAQSRWQQIAKPHGWTLKEATASQFFNPSQGKGINKALANGVGLGNLKNFWLLEWLKVIGFYQIALTRTLTGSKDRKTYVPSVGLGRATMHNDIHRDFMHRMRFSETAIRSDVLAVIYYTQAFLHYMQAAQDSPTDAVRDLIAQMYGEVPRPSAYMHGFHVAYYKDLGNAVTTMNISFLNVPDWVTVNSPADIEPYTAILEEHLQIVRRLREDRGEEIDLLTTYRDFIVADHLAPFFDFTTQYSDYLIREIEKGYTPQLTVENLQRLIMSSDKQEKYTPILEKSGFQNIAYAIRRSTIRPQKEKVKAKQNKPSDTRYDVRYGLGRTLVRQTTSKAEFIAALSDFMFSYNAETSQAEERYPDKSYPRRKIKDSDIQDIIELIDQYKSVEMVAKLLVAYGYADDYKPKTKEEKTDE